MYEITFLKFISSQHSNIHTHPGFSTRSVAELVWAKQVLLLPFLNKNPLEMQENNFPFSFATSIHIEKEMDP